MIDSPESSSSFSLAELLECLHSMQNYTSKNELPLREGQCTDCAVKCGLYTIYSEALRLATPEERLELSKRWFCHESPNMACRGNADNLGISW